MYNPGTLLLHCASTAEEAKMYLNRGVRVNDRNHLGETALYLAVSQKKDMALVETLLAGGADSKIATALLDTPLHQAYSAEIVDQLVSHGAEVNAVNLNGCSPLHNAVKFNKDLKIIKALLSANANVNMHLKGSEETCLHLATTANVARELLSNGAAVNALDKLGRTPLHTAIINKKPISVVQELLKNEAEIEIFDLKGYTPMISSLIICPVIYQTITKLLDNNPDELVRAKVNLLLKTSKYETLDYESRKYFLKFVLLTNFDGLREELFNNFLCHRSPNFIYNCVCEIRQMKMDKFMGDKTLYDVVMKKVKVKPLRPSYKTDKYRLLATYPIYFDIIWHAIKPYLDRGPLINKIIFDSQLATIIYQKEKMKSIVLNHDCVQEISLYLSNEDLENFIEAYENCG